MPTGIWLFLPLLLIWPLVLPASTTTDHGPDTRVTSLQDAAPTCQGCRYSFHPPNPIVTLPPAQPFSPGDVQLTPGMPFGLTDGRPLNPGEGCNGDDAAYLDDDGEWTHFFTDIHGTRRPLKHFYMTGQHQLMVRTIQSNERNLHDLLNGRTVRLTITCNNGLESCVTFVVGQGASMCPNGSGDSNSVSSLQSTTTTDATTEASTNLRTTDGSMQSTTRAHSSTTPLTTAVSASTHGTSHDPRTASTTKLTTATTTISSTTTVTSTPATTTTATTAATRTTTNNLRSTWSATSTAQHTSSRVIATQAPTTRSATAFTTTATTTTGNDNDDDDSGSGEVDFGDDDFGDGDFWFGSTAPPRDSTTRQPPSTTSERARQTTAEASTSQQESSSAGAAKTQPDEQGAQSSQPSHEELSTTESGPTTDGQTTNRVVTETTLTCLCELGSIVAIVEPVSGLFYCGCLAPSNAPQSLSDSGMKSAEYVTEWSSWNDDCPSKRQRIAMHCNQRNGCSLVTVVELTKVSGGCTSVGGSKVKVQDKGPSDGSNDANLDDADGGSGSGTAGSSLPWVFAVIGCIAALAVVAFTVFIARNLKRDNDLITTAASATLDEESGHGPDNFDDAFFDELYLPHAQYPEWMISTTAPATAAGPQ